MNLAKKIILFCFILLLGACANYKTDKPKQIKEREFYSSNGFALIYNKGLFEEGGIDNVERAMRRASREQIIRLERALTFLATTASTAPFIGLFGTVWGIMNAFLGLSLTRTSTIQAVAPGIAEALIATAIGLAAAIPSVMAYNHFSRKVRVMASDMENFSAEFLNIAERHFL